MGQSFLDPLSEITQALGDIEANDGQARTYLAKCIDDLLHTEAKSDDELRDVLHEYLPVFGRLISFLPEDDTDTPYYRSIAAIIRGDQGYLTETERFYAAKSAEVPSWLDWFAADQYFVSILVGLPVLGNWDNQIEEKIIRAHQKYAAKYFPKSAFDLYCKFWASKSSDQHRLRLLRDAVEKDPQWVWAWVEMGDIYYNLPQGLQSGWGDNIGGRTSYTIEEINEGKLYDQIIFNTISDSTIGDEKNFVGAREDKEQTPGETRYWNGNLIDVDIGKEYVIRIYGHNNSPRGYNKVAEDVEIQFQIPSESGKSIAVHGLLSSSNANPSVYWDGVVFTCDTPFHLEYVQGSALFENNGVGAGGFQLPDDIVNNWVTVGYDKIDGRIPGCYQYSFYATIRVKIVEDIVS